MLDLKLLDVAIGVVFFFVFACLLASAARELIEGVAKYKAALMKRALCELLDEEYPVGGVILKSFYEHPLINSLYRGKYSEVSERELPSYIPATHFASALLDLAVQQAPEPQRKALDDALAVARPQPPAAAAIAQAKFQAVLATASKKSGVHSPNIFDANPRVKEAILWALKRSNGDIVKAREALETWYDNSMERATGWYKSHTQKWLLGIGFVIAVLLNLDTLNIIDRLYSSEEFRMRSSPTRRAPAKTPNGRETTGLSCPRRKRRWVLAGRLRTGTRRIRAHAISRRCRL